MKEKPAVLFVCLGNICRSPLAEAAFRAEARLVELEADIGSAGLGAWHLEEPPDPRAQAVARRHGIDIGGYRARQITAGDFNRFTHIVALDPNNLHTLRGMRPAGNRSDISLLLDHVDGRAGQAVADPYYGEADDFERTWKDVSAGARALAIKLARGG